MMIGQRAALFAKGMCMGVADVIPGVSGGTLALILGIYAELLNTIKGLNIRWLPLLWQWVKGGRKVEDREALVAALLAMNLPFLITLVSGIATAIVSGSFVIPKLMESFPELMRGFFFGLILASVYVPARMVWDVGRQKALAVGLVFAILGAGFGYKVTDPSQSYVVATTWQPFETRAETLKDLARRGPTSATLEQLYWAEQNGALRDAVAAATPEKAAALEALHKGAGEQVMDKKLLKARQTPYEDVMVPAGVAVQMPQPALWFIFIAGAIAICAMILPGISGSYLLLIFGVYFFILNALKGLLSLPLKGELPVSHLTYVSVFVVALVAGILSFARLLSFLLNRFPAPTLGALVGLMLGCLRGIWPFRHEVAGVAINVWPGEAAGGVAGAAGACLVGVLVVIALTIVGKRLGADEPVAEEA
jgi:putative membrane protein